MKKKLPVIFFILVFVAGLSLLLYPTVSDWWNRNHQSHAVAEYHAAVEGMTKEEKDAIRAAAEDYNRRLYEMHRGGAVSEEELLAEYPNQLNIFGDGMMGVIDIPKINVRIPIRHGTDEATLQDSVGHIETSSLPVGGANTHCVLSGHTGLPSARLFTDLEQMEIGDTFTMEVLGLELSYTVDQILVVWPWQAESLAIADGMDYVTLITCTPYGVNSHRLLVRGVRTGTAEIVKPTADPNATPRPVEDETPDTELAWWLRDEKLPIYVAVGAVVLLIILMLLVTALRRRKWKKKRDKERAKTAKNLAKLAKAEKEKEAGAEEKPATEEEPKPEEEPGTEEQAGTEEEPITEEEPKQDGESESDKTPKPE